MVPLFRYMTFEDLRSTNEFHRAGLGNRNPDPTGLYAGPGVRRDPQTGRIHIRLAHTKLPGLGENHYRGETDPRKLPLVISGHDYTVRIEGARHVRFQDLVIRGAERSAVLIAEDSEAITQDAEDLEFDGVTFYGSDTALRVSRTSRLKLINCVFRGHKAPWHSRFHLKNRAGAGYLVYAAGRDFELAHCEFTDHHDCIQLYYVNGMRFHHNLVDNFDDDGIEPGPKKERGKIFIYLNHISRCQNPFTAHGKKSEPVESEEGSGVYLFRNVVDLRQGTYHAPPWQPDPSGAFLNHPSEWLSHNHGSPTLPNYYVYHNTFLMQGKAKNSFYAFTWGTHTHRSKRRVFNNIFVQVEGLPGLNVKSLSADDDFQADGNLYWGAKDGPKHEGDFFGKVRRSALFEASKKRYPPGWGASDRFADPKFVSLGGAGTQPPDLRLRKDSPAIDAGVALPADWPDPFRKQDEGRPDLGALPLGAEPSLVGPGRRPDHADAWGGSAKEREKLEGTWRFVKSPDGADKNKEKRTAFGIIFKGESITFVAGGNKGTVQGTYRIDPSKNPKTMDIILDKGGEKMITQAIYDLNGNTLRICHYLYKSAAEARPKEFVANKQTVLGILRRDKE
jgi:uncharacterized protein (TIGR03067 family)